MKLIELLSRYLSKRNTRRDRRQKASVLPSAITRTETQLEPRVLLSGSSGDTTSTKPTISISTTGVANQGTITIASGAGSFSITTADIYAAAAGVFDFDTAKDFLNLSIVQSTAVLDDAFKQPVNAISKVGTLWVDADGFHADLNGNVSDQFRVLSVTGANTRLEFSYQDLPVDSFDAIQRVDDQVDGTKISPIATARSQSSAARSTTDNASSTAESFAREPEGQSDAGESTNTAVNASASQRSSDLFFARAQGNPLWAIDLNTESLTTDEPKRPTNDIPTQMTVRAEQEQFDHGRHTNSLDPLKRKTFSASQKTSAARTSVFTTSDSKTAFAELLNSLVQFDTSELLEEDQELTDWLSDQLGLAPIDAGSQDTDVTNTAGSFADANEPGHSNEQLERLQQAYLKIDYLATPEAFSLILSDQPPEPPDVVSIWQQIRFDCSPRGPPVSDQISGSFVTYQNANAVQLEQLRHSIAPRGPSAVSVN